MRLSARTTLARILAAQQRFEKARLLLQAVSSEARRRSLLGHRLEADLFLGRVMLASSEKSRADQVLRSVKAEAASNGFQLIAVAHNLQLSFKL